MNTSDYQQEFDKIIARKYFDKTLEKTRKEAFSKFLNLGIPTKKWENWRHTDLSLINKQSGQKNISFQMSSQKAPT